jgi:tetratricopeptide (TPR) repeat protein
MPYTLNGIGTHYYGHRNPTVRHGFCEACQASGQLESYETRLWFVILFIPVIPLKRLKIIDQCPRCSRHFAFNPDEWESARQLSVSDSLTKYRQSPNVEGALQVHAAMLSFHMSSEANEFREAALLAHPRNPELLRGLASHLQQFSQYQTSQELFDQAFELDPENPFGRTQRALHLLDQPDQLDEVWELVRFLMEPGAGQVYDLAVLDLLAQRYQALGNHERALVILQHLLTEFPAAAENHEVRKLVAASERALGRTTSVLPRRRFSLREVFDSRGGKYPAWMRWTAFLSLSALVLILGMAGLNEYYRRHRTLYLVNAFGQPAQFTIDAGPAIEVVDQRKVDLPEGRHRIAVTGPLAEAAEINMETPYFSRWTNDPIWIFNPGNAGLVIRHDLHYAAAPRPAQSTRLDGEIQYVPHVDYPFTSPPRSLRLDNRNSVVKKVGVEVESVDPAMYFPILARTAPPAVALSYAESFLRRYSRHQELLDGYLGSCRGQQIDQAVSFLRSGLWNEPLSIEWHRTYQDLPPIHSHPEPLIEEYQARLRDNPRDARLLYLLARLTSTPDHIQLLKEAHEIDPTLGWPAYALASVAMSNANWDEANRWLAVATQALPENSRVHQQRHRLALATGDFSLEESILQSELRNSNPSRGYRAAIWLAESCAKRKQYDEARRVITQFESQFRSPGDPVAPRSQASLLIDYLCEQTPQPAPAGTEAAFSAMDLHFRLAKGDLSNLPTPEQILQLGDSWTLPASIALACRLAGQEEAWQIWLTATATAMQDTSPRETRPILDWIQNTKTPQTEDLQLLNGMDPGEKALCCLLLSYMFPTERERLVSLARQLHIERFPPALLLDRVLDAPATR